MITVPVIPPPRCPVCLLALDNTVPQAIDRRTYACGAVWWRKYRTESRTFWYQPCPEAMEAAIITLAELEGLKRHLAQPLIRSRDPHVLYTEIWGNGRGARIEFVYHAEPIEGEDPSDRIQMLITPAGRPTRGWLMNGEDIAGIMHGLAMGLQACIEHHVPMRPASAAGDY